MNFKIKKVGWLLAWWFFELLYFLDKKLKRDVWHHRHMADEYKCRFKFRYN